MRRESDKICAALNATMGAHEVPEPLVISCSIGWWMKVSRPAFATSRLSRSR